MQEGKALMRKEIYQRYNSRDEIDDKQIHKNSTEETRKKTRRKPSKEKGQQLLRVGLLFARS